MILSLCPRPISVAPKGRGLLLLVKPAKKSLEPWIFKNLFDGIELVPEFIVRPRLVNEILARLARRNGFSSSLATRHHVMLVCGYLALAECTLFTHVADQHWEKISRAREYASISMQNIRLS